MLGHLQIENYALIDRLDTDICPGLTVITGETGAGKSIILGALSLILGERADTKVLNDKSRKCIIEGTFHLENTNVQELFTQNDLDYDHVSYFRREITPNGKSRAFVNDTPVTLAVMRSITGHLIDIHSQHQSLLVGKPSFQVDVIDSFAGILDQADLYRSLFRTYSRKKSRLAEALEKNRTARADLDYYRYQFEELDKAALDPETHREAENELAVLQNAEGIRQAMDKARYMMEESEPALLDHLREVLALVRPLQQFGAEYAELFGRLESILIEAKDIGGELLRISETIDYSPRHYQDLEARIDAVNKLLMKHQADSVEELVKVREGYRDKIRNIDVADERTRQLQDEVSQLENEVHAMASTLADGRKKAIPDIEKELVSILKSLGMPGARMKIQQKAEDEPGPNGIDNFTFLFNANVGGALEEISRIASGGELSRVMLGIKSIISRKKLLPTIIFDEIDTGISGETSGRVASMLDSMSDQMQVIAITHVPQIAARGIDHLLVFKEVTEGTTRTFLKKLTETERISEVAKMLGGKKPSKHMVETAKELIFNNEN